MQINNVITGEVETYESEAAFLKKRDDALLAWEEKKLALDKLKAEEMEARKLAVGLIATAEKIGKTENVPLGNGYSAKLKVPVKYGFVHDADDKIDKVRIEKALSKIEKDPNGELIAERLIKWDPNLSLTEYKQLSPKHKAIIDEVIITENGTPTLEIVEPKK